VFSRQRLIRAQLAAAKALVLARRVVTPEPSSDKQIATMTLKSRVLFSPSRLAAALMDNVEPTAKSIDASVSFDHLLGDDNADGLNHLDVADASDLLLYGADLEKHTRGDDSLAALVAKPNSRGVGMVQA